MNFKADDFKIVYGSTEAEIEEQVKALLEKGYILHGTLVAQPNAHFSSDAAVLQQPYFYYQMLARQKPASSQAKPEESVD